MSLTSGTRLGPYEILVPLGAGPPKRSSPTTATPAAPGIKRVQLVRIYTLVGEPEKALDQLEPLLKIPYFISPAWLKIDPNFDPLRGNPRFQKLVAAAK